jgi:hypothetical protein
VKGIFYFFIEEKNIFFVHATVLSLKTAFDLVKIHLLFRIIPFGCASGNIDPKPGMSHYIPCLIAE